MELVKTKAQSGPKFPPILLGSDAETGEPVNWNPDPDTGLANPHALILGESGFGKTYTICCLLAELSERGVHSLVFHYGQGFAANSAPREFVEWVRPVEIAASLDGIDVNPLQIFSTERPGPVNVATARGGHLQPGIYEARRSAAFRSTAGRLGRFFRRWYNGGQSGNMARETRPPSARCMRDLRSLQRVR